MATIGENIYKLRTDKKWTRSELAQKMGYNAHTTITKWETGQNHPRGRDIQKICKLFNVSADFLLGLSNVESGQEINYYRYLPANISAGALQTVNSMSEEDMKWLAVPDDVMGKYSGTNDILFVNVSGTSMNKIIGSGARVGIRKTDTLDGLKNGDIVVFSVDDEFSIKRFYNDETGRKYIFKPESTDAYHTDIVVWYCDAHKIQIHGKVVVNISQYA